MTVVQPAAIDLAIAWDPVGAAPSRRLHGGLQSRLAEGDPHLLDAFDRLVACAEAASAVVSVGKD